MSDRQFSLIQAEFSRELASFVNFIGGDVLDSVLSRVILKLASYSPQVRVLFGDRYFFQEQWLQIIEQQFQLDIANPLNVRVASLIAGTNRVRAALSPVASHRLRAAIVGALSPDQDFRQLEHEIRCYTHFGRKGFDVRFADLEGVGQFDLLLQMPSVRVEAECKTVSEDTGLQIKRQMSANLFEIFSRVIKEKNLPNGAGIVSMTLNKPADKCINLIRSFENALQIYQIGEISLTDDFTLTFEPRPHWSSMLEANQMEALRKAIAEDPYWAGSDYFALQFQGKVIGLSLRPHKQGQLRRRLTEVLKDAASQCTGTRAGILWLHFVGTAEPEFLELAHFSMNSRGGGLNSITASVVHPRATTTDRSHVHTVRFSAIAQAVTNKPAFGRDRLLTRATSLDGTCYDVPNPYCRYPLALNF